MKDLDIIPECYIDTNIVEFLLNNTKGNKTDGVNHQKGCNTVANNIQKNKQTCNGFALGVIDSDKRQPSYIKEFREIGHYGHIKLMKHHTKNHFFIMIEPAMDSLILSCAAEVGVNMEDYDLASELKDFTKITKDVDSKKDSRFKRLFNDIKGAKEFILFGNLLSYLKNHKYDYDEMVLKNYFNLE